MNSTTTRAFKVVMVCLLLLPGLILVLPDEPVGAYSPSSSSPTLAIYPPPAIASDNHLYPFLVQAESAGGAPLDLNATVYLSSSSRGILDPTASEVSLVDGQGVFYANATNAGSVWIYAGAQGFLPSSVDVEVVTPVKASPNTLNIVTPSIAIEGEQVPLIVESESAGGYPIATSLSFELSSSPLGGNISKAPLVELGSFQGGAYSIEYVDLPSNGTWALSASGDYFSPGNQSLVNVLNASGEPQAGNGVYSLQASYPSTVSVGSTWSVIIYPTVNGFPTNLSSFQHLSSTSSDPSVASVVGSPIESEYYEIFYVQASKIGSAAITFQSQGYLPVTITLNCVASQHPFTIRAYGPSSSYANPSQLLEVVSTPMMLSNISLPIHLDEASAEVTSSYSGVAEQGVYFTDGFAELNITSLMIGPATFLAQSEGMFASNFSAALLYTPFTVTIESNVPNANFTVQSVENKGYVLTNSSIQLSEPSVVSAPPYMLTSNETTQYEFSYWQGSSGNSTTDYVQSTSIVFAYYTKNSFLTTLGTNLPLPAINMSVSYYQSNSTRIVNKTETGTFTLVAPHGLTVSTPATVLGSDQGALYVFTGWSDGVNAATRFVSAGSNTTAEYMTEYMVSASTSYGQQVLQQSSSSTRLQCPRDS
ncbi:MAG: hypothetical protein M1587_10635 [Thaumarchaeota archaeon]|nr:hypothetical protein [Nitrososphaerota archaeon]